MTLGATPQQVYIDGIAQIKAPYSSRKPASFQHYPRTPNFDKEALEAVEYDGLPPLDAENAKSDVVIFTNVRSIYLRQGHTIHEVLSGKTEGPGSVVVRNGTVVCAGTALFCSTFDGLAPDPLRVDLEGGSISYVAICITLTI